MHGEPTAFRLGELYPSCTRASSGVRAAYSASGNSPSIRAGRSFTLSTVSKARIISVVIRLI
jgi:hypothetical protein